MENNIYKQLGARPVINARGTYSSLGGSVLSPRVWAAMSEANHQFASMSELLDSSGAVISKLLGAEAARVTPGASGAIVQGIAACIAIDMTVWSAFLVPALLRSELSAAQPLRIWLARSARGLPPSSSQPTWIGLRGRCPWIG